MYVRLFFKENTTGSVCCGRGERKDTDGIKAEGVYGNGNGKSEGFNIMLKIEIYISLKRDIDNAEICSIIVV